MREETWVDRVVQRNRNLEALPRRTYVPSEERLNGIGADMEADKGQLDKLQRKLTEAEQRIVALEAHIEWMAHEIAAIIERAKVGVA